MYNIACSWNHQLQFEFSFAAKVMTILVLGFIHCSIQIKTWVHWFSLDPSKFYRWPKRSQNGLRIKILDSARA